jgi:histidinol dehydrogenase
MVQWLRTRDPDFEAGFAHLLTARRDHADDVGQAVAAILREVRKRGDEALIEFTRTFDRFDLAASGIRLSDAEIEAAVAKCPGNVRESLEFAAGRIDAYHRRQRPTDERYTDHAGIELGHRWTPVEAAGLYVPGGLNAYPSSVLMNAIPARTAGVARIAMVVPTPDGHLDPQVVMAARIAGVDEIYRVGGAQAIAALAFGTATIAPVAKIVGPGNAYVAEAKRQVFGTVGIDMIAGPSEVVILADGDNDPEWLAADLLAQAEHDASAQSILVTDSEDLAMATAAAVERQLAVLPRHNIASASWTRLRRHHRGGVLTQALPLVDRLAPSISRSPPATPRPGGGRAQRRRDLHRPLHAGSHRRLRGRPQPRAPHRQDRPLLLRPQPARLHEAHLDPQARCARVAALAPHAVTLARAEGLEAHARSISVRLGST